MKFVSNLTGQVVNKTQATSVQYWEQHLLKTVLFEQGMSQVFSDKASCCIEIGPGRTLATFAVQNKNKAKTHQVLTSIRHVEEEQDDLAVLLTLVGRLWLSGVELDYAQFYAQERRNKISIPTYCFDHKKYWVEPKRQRLSTLTNSLAAPCIIDE